MPEARTGLDEFKEVLKGFRGLSLWAVGAGVSAPFITAFLDVTPPWPRGIASITAIVELLTLICAFQFLGSAGRRRLNRVMIASLLAAVVTGIAYLTLFVPFHLRNPNNERDRGQWFFLYRRGPGSLPGSMSIAEQGSAHCGAIRSYADLAELVDRRG
jgi:hypothetical protein